MHKKLLTIGFAVLLLLSIIPIMVPAGYAPAADAIYVDPDSYLTAPELDTLEYCDTFTVDVMVNLTTPFYGWDYQLFWDPDNINLTSYTVNIPTEWGANWFKPKDDLTVAGRHWVGVSALAPAPPVSGVRSLCTYNFHVIETVWVDTIGTLDLQNTKLADQAGDPIIHTTHDGEYRKCAPPIPDPILKVSPSKTFGVCGQLFNVSIVITDLHAQKNLWGWEANLTFNNVHLTAMNSYEGPFLPSFAGPNGTYYVNVINNPTGTVLSAGGFLGNHTVPQVLSPNVGVLSIIEFNASFQTIAPDIQSSAFTLINTKLVGQDEYQQLYNVNHTVVNGVYNVPYKVVGWFLDCYTDRVRKKNVGGVTDYIGLGINVSADSYETQDLVVLRAYLEYNFQPECNKIVMFEIYSEDRGISIIRTAMTNCSGIATINFTIPNIPSAYGHWVCYQAAQVKIYEKPEDWLWWKVGWIVEITNVTVIPEEAYKCDIIEIVVEYKSISYMPCKVLFTIVILDELLDPICEYTWWVNATPAEPYLCSEMPGVTYGYCHIPCFAHAGKATVYVNAFTNFPMLCGCPFCPEKSAIFWIIATLCPP